MFEASTPLNETARLACLQQLAILDTPPEERFDRITRLAVRFFQMPIAAVSLIDANRVWLKSRIGVPFTSIPRQESFCGHVIATGATVVVCDTYNDDRFANNPYVIQSPCIRSYVGVPLYSPQGYPVGTLCMLDHKPRKISKKNLEAFMSLAAIAGDELASVDTNRAVAEQFYNEKWGCLLLNHLSDAIVIVDQYGIVEFCNPAAEAMFRGVPTSLVGIMAGALTTNAVARLIGAADGSDRYQVHKATGQRTDGSLFPMQLSVTQMYLGSKKKYAVIVRDISAKKNSEALRQAAEERRRTYYANAAHELRSPLGSILGFANMLSKRRLPDETVSEVAGIMSTETTRLVKLIDEMLDFATLEAIGSADFNIQVQSLGPVIETTLQSLGGITGIERVVVHPARAIPDVAIDASKMQQALTNIISNAIKYSPDGGQIDIMLHVLHTEQGQVVQLEVADRGIGMTPAQTVRIFEPFYRARHLPSVEGSGLGMTITRELIACQNGAMSVESALG